MTGHSGVIKIAILVSNGASVLFVVIVLIIRRT